jgi:hypothetical protein
MMTIRSAAQAMAIGAGIASFACSGSNAAPASAMVRAQWKVCLTESMVTLLRDASCRSTMTQMGLTASDVAKLGACIAMTPQQRFADSHCQQLLHDHPGAMG